VLTWIQKLIKERLVLYIMTINFDFNQPFVGGANERRFVSGSRRHYGATLGVIASQRGNRPG